MSNETVYKEQIKPLMEQIKIICDENGVSYVASFKADEESLFLSCNTTPETDPPEAHHLCVDILQGVVREVAPSCHHMGVVIPSYPGP